MAVSEKTIRHWHKEPAESTLRFADNAQFARVRTGLRVVLELTAYPDGHAGLVVSGQSLPFNSIEEAKDAIDLIAGRLAEEA